MKIYSADTWTLEELQEQISDAGRRTLLVPPATTKQAVLEVFGQVLDFPEYYGVNLDALNDSLHEYADALSEDDGSPVTMIWQVPPAYRTDRSFGVVCEILQDAERYAGRDLAVIAIFEN